MLSAGVIRESRSSYSSTIVIVAKKKGEPRFCVDYRRLNSLTARESATLPPLNDLIRSLGTSKIFSIIDLKSGYWHIPIEEYSKQFTAFSTPEGLQFEFNVLPFGLENAPASQKTMNHVLTDYIGKFCGCYIDGIEVYSENLEEHIDSVRSLRIMSGTSNISSRWSATKLIQNTSSRFKISQR